MAAQPTRILLIDSYDSFTYNLASLCKQSIPSSCVHIVKNDLLTLSQLIPYLRHFAAVVVGPGPGSPENSKDIGIVSDLWKLADEHLLPIFGVCLGLQSLAIEYGGSLKKLKVVKHGQISRVIHEGRELFKGVGDVDAVRYHSLYAELPSDGSCPLEVLGFADDIGENGPITMAIKHTTKPFWAVQYHPESICTSSSGAEVLNNFWRLATNWNRSRGRIRTSWTETVEDVIGQSWPQNHARPWILTSFPPLAPLLCKVNTHVLHSPDLAASTICELLGVQNERTPFVLLDSAARPGRFTIIGALRPESAKITYFVGDTHVSISTVGDNRKEPLGSCDIWNWLANYMRLSKVPSNGSSECGFLDVPFWGGLIGYLSYELGVESLAVPLSGRSGRHPDVNLVFVERSIVLDSVTGMVYIQTLLCQDDIWIEQMTSTLENLSKAPILPSAGSASPTTSRRLRDTSNKPSSAPIITLPNKSAYISRIKHAKAHLFAGESYELCVTAPTRIIRDKTTLPLKDQPYNSSSWNLYKTLRTKNPAPYAAYIRLHPSTLVASSPERFLSYTRGPHTVCQLHPIKGTLRKGPGVTRAIAEQALRGSKKEVAENLMIVDLIRHDLHGVVGEDVQVRKFCGVEENETVWSLVSVIEGKLPTSEGTTAAADSGRNVGWEVLSRSLPPGSMTGAPKKRSVQILQTLEDKPRSIYSGVLGYWCVGGSGDWSVCIRSCFKFDDQFESDGRPTLSTTVAETFPDVRACVENPKEEWVIGAGGAITALSDPEAEWDEMVVKLQSVLRVFGASTATTSEAT